MVATKRKGTKLEHEFKEYFEKWGYYCIRSAGSFDVDLIALKKGCLPLIVNVKWLRKYCGPAERLDIIQKADKAGGLPLLCYKEIPKGKKNGNKIIDILTDMNKRGDRLALVPSRGLSQETWEVFLKHYQISILDKLYKTKQTVDLGKAIMFSGLHPGIPQER